MKNVYLISGRVRAGMDTETETEVAHAQLIHPSRIQITSMERFLESHYHSMYSPDLRWAVVREKEMKRKEREESSYRSKEGFRRIPGFSPTTDLHAD